MAAPPPPVKPRPSSLATPPPFLSLSLWSLLFKGEEAEPAPRLVIKRSSLSSSPQMTNGKTFEAATGEQTLESLPPIRKQETGSDSVSLLFSPLEQTVGEKLRAHCYSHDFVPTSQHFICMCVTVVYVRSFAACFFCCRWGQ